MRCCPPGSPVHRTESIGCWSPWISLNRYSKSPAYPLLIHITAANWKVLESVFDRILSKTPGPTFLTSWMRLLKRIMLSFSRASAASEKRNSQALGPAKEEGAPVWYYAAFGKFSLSSLARILQLISAYQNNGQPAEALEVLTYYQKIAEEIIDEGTELPITEHHLELSEPDTTVWHIAKNGQLIRVDRFAAYYCSSCLLSWFNWLRIAIEWSAS